MEGSWSRVKKTKDAEVWRRDSNEEGFPPITKVHCMDFMIIVCRLCFALFLSSLTTCTISHLQYSDAHRPVCILLVKCYI